MQGNNRNMVPRVAIDLRKLIGAASIKVNATRIAGLKPALSAQTTICANNRIESVLFSTLVTKVFFVSSEAPYPETRCAAILRSNGTTGGIALAVAIERAQVRIDILYEAGDQVVAARYFTPILSESIIRQILDERVAIGQISCVVENTVSVL